ncbi:MAG: hypothetical protein U0518_05845 [Candidatus Gracilibacteria bacterium]
MQKHETVREYLARKKNQFLESFLLFQEKKSGKTRTYSSSQTSHYLPKYQKYTSSRALRKKWYEHIGVSSEQAFLFRELFRAKRGVFFLLSLLAFCLSLSTFTYWAYYSSYFDIAPSNVIIESTDGFTDINKAYDSIASIYRKKLYLLDKDQITKNLQKDQKQIATVSVDALYPNGVRISITAQKPLVSIKTGDKEIPLVLSQSGIFMNVDRGLADVTMLGQIALLPGDKERIKPGVSTLDTTTLESLRYIINYLTVHEWNMIGLKVQEVTLLEQEREIHIKYQKGSLFFIMNNKINEQIQNLELFASQNPTGFQNALYIDARVAKRIFVCNEIAACQQNLSVLYPRFYGNSYR